MERTDRLLALVLRLKTHGWQRAEDLAEALGVSTRTIYRDVRALEAAGIPLRGVPGTGYRLRSDPFLPAVPPALFAEDDVDAVHRTLRRALREARAVRYKEKATDTLHEIHPYGLIRRSGATYLIGYDVEAGGVRHVPLHRVADVELQAERFERPSGYRPPPGTTDETGEIIVRVRFTPEAAPLVRQQAAAGGMKTARDADGLLVTFSTERLDAVVPWLLGWGRHARVLVPEALRARVAAEARTIAAHYQWSGAELFFS